MIKQDPIRVLHVLASLNRGGAESLVINLYKAIDKSLVQFDFIVHYKTEGGFVEEVKRLGGNIYICPKISINIFKYIRWWYCFFKEHPKYRIIHSHIRSTALFYLPIAHKFGLKTIIHSHSTSNGIGIEAKIKAVLQYPLRKLSDYFAACSKISGQWLFGSNIVTYDNFIVIPNAIDLAKFRFNLLKREEMRSKLKIENKHVFIHVGGFRDVKNHAFLLEVFKAIHDNDPMSTLLLVGGGELENEILNKIGQLKLTDSVKMLGKRGDVCDLLQGADCFLFPSKWEGVPTVVIEAQASGLPCLVSDKISDDVMISQLVKKLPIDKGVGLWVNEVKKISYERLDVCENIKKCGYDINDVAKRIEKFYNEML